MMRSCTPLIEANHGQVIKSTGDGLYAVFASAADGVNAAVASQRALHAEAWPVTGPLRVRMALHTGEAELREGDYFGPTLNRTARLMAVGAGGQCLLSQATAALLQEQLPAQVTLRDLGEHRLKDLVRSEHVYQLAVPDLPAEFPPLKSLNTYRHNLPVQLTSFVGREQEIEEIRRLLGSTRLLTLTGPGGTGKTRLALEVGTAALPMFADGVWLVELAPLTDGALAAETVASVFDLTQAKRPPMSALTSHLRDKHLLLILDNCEHLIQASAELAESLLRACAGLQILTTSRERLGITGEVVWPVASLNSTAALQLFEERAKAARPSFSLSGQNATTVSQICTRLDGIPLAIELAASRLGVLPVEQIAARLDDRFRLLTGGSRTALPRHRTLLALIDWSYDLLSEEEQRLLRRLSIFANGWTLEAAEEIYGSADALESLSQLVNKSLVVLDDQGRYARYRLLETIRRYAQEKLTEMGERESACQRLLEWCTDLAETANPHLGGPQEDLWLERMESEIDNLRAALGWALGSQKSEEALRLAAALGRFWGMRGHLTEGREWLRQALAVGHGASKGVQNEARIYAASMARKQGDYEAATDYLRESLEQSRQLGNKGAVARVLNSLGRVADEQGDQVTSASVV